MLEKILLLLAPHKNKTVIFLAALAVAVALVFSEIGASLGGGRFAAYFLNVGQGDTSLLIFPSGVKMLIDGGPPNGRVLAELAKTLPSTDRYLDLVVMSHPQSDHFGGLIEVVKRYRVGAFLAPAREGEGSAFAELRFALAERGVRTVTLGRGDAIANTETRVDILSPTHAFLTGKETNDAALAMVVRNEEMSLLMAGDAGEKVEASLIPYLTAPVHILKVSHHGSKFSSGAAFLKAARPALAVIEVGKNSYGHPTPEALARLAAAGAHVFRTDEDGTMKIWRTGNELNIFKGF